MAKHPPTTERRRKADPIGAAVALIFQVTDTRWRDALVECLRAATLEAFKAALLAEHERRLAYFRRRPVEPTVAGGGEDARF